MRLAVAALATACSSRAGCREREDADRRRTKVAAPRRRPPTTTRASCTRAPQGSFVDLVARAKHGVVGDPRRDAGEVRPRRDVPGRARDHRRRRARHRLSDRGQGRLRRSRTITSPRPRPSSRSCSPIAPRSRPRSSAATSRSTSRCSQIDVPAPHAAAARRLQRTPGRRVDRRPRQSVRRRRHRVGGHRLGDRPRRRGLARRGPPARLPHVHPDRRAYPSRQLRRPGARHRGPGDRRRGRDRRSPRRDLVRDPHRARPRGRRRAARRRRRSRAAGSARRVLPVNAELAEQLGAAKARAARSSPSVETNSPADPRRRSAPAT